MQNSQRSFSKPPESKPLSERRRIKADAECDSRSALIDCIDVLHPSLN
jgi:hypothetical protein